MIAEFLTVLILLIGGHAIADYPLQGDFLANAKKNGPLRLHHLYMHAYIHGFFVMWITGSLFLIGLEIILHTIIDELKNREIISFQTDQILHILCKVLWAILFVFVI